MGSVEEITVCLLQAIASIKCCLVPPQGNFVLTKFFLQRRLVDPVWNGSKLHHRTRTIKPLRYKNKKLCPLRWATP